jgi:hypothetical protein
MSKIFYDHLIILEELEVHIKAKAQSPEEKEELWGIIDEIIHHRVMGRILDTLPDRFHEEFLTKYHEAPYSEDLTLYLNHRIEGDIEEEVRSEINLVTQEILSELGIVKI